MFGRSFVSETDACSMSLARPVPRVRLPSVSSRKAGPSGEDEGRREQFLQRAKAARELVAEVDPSLLGAEVDVTLHDLTLARSVIERLEDAYRHELGNVWLQELGRANPSGRR
jgi:hypothetical protein